MSAITYTAKRGIDLLGTEVGAWLIDDTAGTITSPTVDTDLSASGFDLSITGSVSKAAVATGAGLMAYSGFAAGNYLSRAYEAGLDITDQITLIAWVKLSSLPVASVGVCGNYNGGSGDMGGCALAIAASGYAMFTTHNGTTGVSASDPVAITAGEWVLLVGVKDSSGNQYLYKNASLVDTATGGVIDATATPFTVGAYHSAGAISGPLTMGSMAGVRVFNGVLTAAQIKTIYDNEKHQFKAYAPFRLVGTQYSLDVVLADESQSTDMDVSVFKSLSGNQETIERSRAITHAVTLGSILHTEKPTLFNFLESVQAGETFSLDIYGSVASPDDPVNVIADAGYQFARINHSNLYNVAMNVREVD